MTGNSDTRVVVGMSGGVDSSTAAALLLEQGHQVIGITLKLWPQDCLSRAEDKCCGPQAVSDARSVCQRLGIPFYLVDEANAFQQEVIAYFAAEYRAGRTPNPCVMCNEKLKFGTLLTQARKLGGTHVATGHYARVERGPDSGRWLLKRGRDPRRDQSYFLFSLRQEQLAHILFPLGELLKTETREHARGHRLKTADKEESMEICFVPDNDYGGFLRKAGLVAPHAGEIVDLDGRVLGRHEGIEFFTIGQRRGLRIAAPAPLYVLDLDPARNRVLVGPASELQRRGFSVARCNWISCEEPAGPVEALVKIRYNHPGTPGMITPLPGGRARVELKEPQRAITPGQASVFYQGDTVLGGGWIERFEHPQP
ncbi:MAG: tRNA 2-thiouridine(34) synthase MnmA [Verrucomicrobiales bacterium]|nr:tRNA 2-thiouridine(34) synthase MnmA [Verrucomicrobiales bacterium]